MVYRNGDFVSVNPETVNIGEKIQVRVGEKIPLDGKLLSNKATNKRLISSRVSVRFLINPEVFGD